MATQKIVNGPSKWDIMLGYFERKELMFTLEDGTAIKVGDIDCMWNMCHCNSLDYDVPEVDRVNGKGGIGEGHLLRGRNAMSDDAIFIEYRPRSRQGLYVALDGYGDEAMRAYLPILWSELMGLDNSYTH